MIKVLFVIPFFPLPAHSGGAIATLETLRSLADSCNLHLLTPRPQTEAEANISALKEILPSITVHYYEGRVDHTPRLEMYTTAALSTVTGRSYWALNWRNRDLRVAVQRLFATHGFNLVHSEWLQTAVSIWDLDIPLLIRTLDVHFLGMREWSEAIPSMDRLRKSFWRAQAERFRLFEVRILSAAGAVVTLSAEDEAALREQGVTNIETIPPPRSVEPTPKKTEQRLDGRCIAVFIGRLDMAVNREAFFIFLDQVWPKISNELRERVRIIFAGGLPDDGLRQRAVAEGIEIQAPLSDADGIKLFKSADVFFSPVQSGTGIKIKTLEAMAQSKPIIGFRNSFRGVPVQNERQALIVNSAEDFARAMERLIMDDLLRSELGTNARKFVEEKFAPSLLGPRLVDAYSRVASNSRQRDEARST